MKKILFIYACLLLSAFSINHDALKIQNGARDITEKSKTSLHLTYSQDDGIIGSWSLVLQALDDNNNGKLDEEERQKGNTGRHYYQFNTDGTCLIHMLKLKGHYELKNEGGKKRLYTYVDDQGTSTRENAWYVISVSKTEMILLSQDKYAFWIFKRV